MSYLDGYEMKEHHRFILTKSRIYLLHNLRPTESLWSALIAKEVLSPDMVDDIKGNRTTNERVGQLLDILPTRGPEAFDKFCESLLECDHAHVGDYLKTVEATDQFRTDIKPHCQDFSEHTLERFVTIFKKHTPKVQRFAERKFELVLEEQERDLDNKEAEIRDLEGKNNMLQLEVSQLRSFLNTCYETSESLSNEVKQEFLSRSFLNEEKKHLENMKSSVKDVAGFEKVLEFYNNMQTVLAFLEKYAGMKDPKTLEQKNTSPNTSLSTDESGNKSSRSTKLSGKGRTLNEKMQIIINLITSLNDNMAGRTMIPTIKVKPVLDTLNQKLQDFFGDVFQIKDTFKATLRQKRKMDGEILSLMHNFQEIRRLERELKEKQTHIQDLHKHSQLLKKKTKHHKKHTDQVQIEIEQKKIQLREIQKHLEKNCKSADVRLHQLLHLLPDLDDQDFLRSDTEMTSDAGSSICRSGSARARIASEDLTGRASRIAQLKMLAVGYEREKTKIPPGKEEFCVKSDSDDKNNNIPLDHTLEHTVNVKKDIGSHAPAGRLLNRPTKLKLSGPVSQKQEVTGTVKPNSKILSSSDNEVNKNTPAVEKDTSKKSENKDISEIDRWLADQEKDNKRKLDEKRKLKETEEQQKKKHHEQVTKGMNSLHAALTRKESEKRMDMKETNSPSTSTNAKSNDVKDRVSSGAGSEKEKGWWEANSGSPNSNTHELQNSLQDVSTESNTRLQMKETSKRENTINKKLDNSSNKGVLKQSHNALHNEKSASTVKHSNVKGTEGSTNLNMMEGVGFGLMDPRASKLKQSYSNMLKEMTSGDLGSKSKKSRQSLACSNIELRLPSK